MRTGARVVRGQDRVVTDAWLHPADYGFELFVSGATGDAARHVAVVRRALALGLDGRFELRVVDARATPEIALANGVTETPTLVRLWPPPVRALTAQLDVPTILVAIDLPAW